MWERASTPVLLGEAELCQFAKDAVELRSTGRAWTPVTTRYFWPLATDHWTLLSKPGAAIANGGGFFGKATVKCPVSSFSPSPCSSGEVQIAPMSVLPAGFSARPVGWRRCLSTYALM